MDEVVSDVMAEIGDLCCGYSTGEYLDFIDRLICRLQDRYNKLQLEAVRYASAIHAVEGEMN